MPLSSIFYRRMTKPEELRALCLDERGAAKPKTECRAAIINHLILEQGLDIDEAEEVAEQTLNQSGLWPEEEAKPAQDVTL